MARTRELIGLLQGRYAAQAKLSNGPKYEHLCQAIQQVIREGLLSPNDRLPPEHVIADSLPLSQVTVRKSLSLLAQRGVVSREHGRGTFIAPAERSVSDLWHFRFIDPESGDLLPIYNRILSRSEVRDRQAARCLSIPSKRLLVRIERSLNIGSRFNCYSELFLPANRFSPILDEPVAELERVNLKDVLTALFQRPTLWISQNVSIDNVPNRACESMGVDSGVLVLALHVTGYSFEDEPITFQRIWIPKTECPLNLPASTNLEGEGANPPRLKTIGTN